MFPNSAKLSMFPRLFKTPTLQGILFRPSIFRTSSRTASEKDTGPGPIWALSLTSTAVCEEQNGSERNGESRCPSEVADP